MENIISKMINRIRIVYRKKGLIATAEKLFLQVPYRHVKGYINYFMKAHKHEQATVFLASFPKGGSTWVARMLSSIDGFGWHTPLDWYSKEEGQADYDLYEGLFDEVKHRFTVIRGHTAPTDSNVRILRDSGLKYIITVRDPRDKIVSAYWYIWNKTIHPYHAFARSRSLEEFIDYKLESGEYKGSIAWMEGWFRNRDEERSMIIRYEDLLRDTHSTFRKILDFLSLKCSEDEINRIVEQNSFKNITGRKSGEEDTKSFFRKGVSGEWKEIFSEEQKKKCSKIGDEVLALFGYESTIN